MAGRQADNAEDAVEEHGDEEFWGVPQQTQLTRAELLGSALLSRQKKAKKPARFAIRDSPYGNRPSLSLKQLLGHAESPSAKATQPEEVEDSSSSEGGAAQPAGVREATQGLQEMTPLAVVRRQPPEQAVARLLQATPLAQTHLQGAQDGGSAQRRFLAANAATLAAASTIKRPRARLRPGAPGSLAAHLEAVLHSAKERKSPVKRAVPEDLVLRVLATETEGPVLKCWCEAENERRQLVLLVKGGAREGVCPSAAVIVQRPWQTLQEAPGFPRVLLALHVLVL